MTIAFDKLKQQWLKEPKVKNAYEALAGEFALAQDLIKARHRAGLTQHQVARRMGISQPTVARLEAGHRPSLRTLERYARATQSHLTIRLVPAKAPTRNKKKRA